MTTIAAFGQSYFGLSAEVGSSYRVLRSDYFVLNEVYHDIESPHIAGSFGAYYKYKFTEKLAAQAGLDYSLLAFRTQIIENHPNESIFEINSQPRPAQSIGKQTHVNRLQVPVLFVCTFKQSGNWRLLAATGASVEIAGSAHINYIFEDNSSQNIRVENMNRAASVIFQFGWINKLANRDEVSFTFRYVQDVVPAKNQEINRYLNLFAFQVTYWFSV